MTKEDHLIGQRGEYWKEQFKGNPWPSSGWDSMFSLPGAQFQFLVKGLAWCGKNKKPPPPPPTTNGVGGKAAWSGLESELGTCIFSSWKIRYFQWPSQCKQLKIIFVIVLLNWHDLNKGQKQSESKKHWW